MMLDHDLATVMTKLFKAVFQADIKASNSFSKNMARIAKDSSKEMRVETEFWKVHLCCFNELSQI